MKKTTFTQRFEKAVKFYDFTYHLHKSTFKGLTSFYRLYSEAERTYADTLISLSKQVWSQIPELNRQNPSLVSTIKQIINCIQTTSQLHFNYSQRLLEVSAFYNSQYLNSKKKKDNQMKILKDRNEEEYAALREREKNRNVLNAKEKDICKVMYSNLDKLAEEENDRIHKVKQQTIIYFSLYKKVCQKQLQWTSEYNLKLIKQEFQVKNPKIAEMAQQLRTQFNQYGGQQIQRKSYDINQSMLFNRQSLRASMAMKQRISRVSETQNKLKKMLEKYEAAPDGLLLMNQTDTYYGLFDSTDFGKDQRRKYSREINSQILKNISYDMIEGYARNKNANSDEFLLLQLIKSSLKYKSTWLSQPDLSSSKLPQYLAKCRSQITDKDYIFHLRILQQLSKFPIHNSITGSKLAINSNNYQKIDEIILKKHKNQLSQVDIKIDQDFNFIIKCCIIDILIQSVCNVKGSQPVLPEGCVDYLHLFGDFAEGFFGLSRGVVVLLMLRKVDRLIADKNTNQQIQLIAQDQYFLSSAPKFQSSISSLPSTWSTLILNNTTSKLLNFFNIPSYFLNNLKILITLDKLHLSPNSSFNARDHFYTCIRCAGFNYLKTSQQCIKIFDSDIGVEEKEQRLKDIVEGVQELDFVGVVNGYFNHASVQIAKLFGVGEKAVRNKLFQEFTYSLYQIIGANLTILSEQQGVDRDGYILRLGIIFAKLDIQNPQPISEYQTFFKVLKNYLEATEKDYDNMLEHSRKTQLWIMQQNALATPNCVDFCSLLYKPFEFLLISLKELQKSRKTEYTAKYSEFIKLRLNSVLKTQIIKYINFLYQSLANYRNQVPSLSLKPTRTLKPNKLQKQFLQKQRQVFKQLTRRLFNLMFLKQQLQEMVYDFIQPDIYKQMNNTIFNVNQLNKVAAMSPQYRDILGNIKEIVQAVLMNQERIVRRVAGITVCYCMAKVFQNLYFQEEKNAIQEFFSNAGDYKLSEHTLLRYQEVLQDWFTLIVKNMPDPYRKPFQLQFSKQLFNSIQYQILNSTKFKLPLKQQSVCQYLDSDVTFLTTTMRQKFFDTNLIQQQIKIPFKYLLSDIQSETSKLMTMFESATLKNDKDRCRYILAILNLRVKDEKAQEFVKKYKSISQA